MENWLVAALVALIGTLAVGILTNALFEWAVRPLGVRAFSTALKVVTLNAQRSRDRIVKNAIQLGPQQHVTVMVLLITLVGVLAMVTFVGHQLDLALFGGPLQLPLPESVRGPARIVLLAMALVVSGFAAILTLRTMLECMASSGLYYTVERTLHILAGKLSDKAIKGFRADFLQLETEQDLRNFRASVVEAGAAAGLANLPVEQGPWIDDGRATTP